jgi:hypothetical protein
MNKQQLNKKTIKKGIMIITNMGIIVLIIKIQFFKIN